MAIDVLLLSHHVMKLALYITLRFVGATRFLPFSEISARPPAELSPEKMDPRKFMRGARCIAFP